MVKIKLKPGREKPLLRRHPWIYSGAIAEVVGAPGLGETVDVFAFQGGFLARGAYSPESQIRVRVWGWDADVVIDEAFFRHRLQAAIARRQLLMPKLFVDQNTGRLVHAESDGIPGLVVDGYGDTLVMQVLSAGIERWRQTLADLLLELTGAEHIYERSDAAVRRLEGLPQRTGALRGSQPPERVEIVENDIRFWVNLQEGHKTGFYFDQRWNRERVQNMAAGRDVLDCFTYTGGFTLNALAGEAASVTAVDSSADVLALARENLALNEFSPESVDWVEGDVFNVLRKFRDEARSFDMIILDPPKFAPTRAQAKQAARGYKDINLLAFKLLRPGGLLVTFSCSGGISARLFQKIVADAAVDAKVDAQIVEWLHQGADHPVLLHFPEGAYLKGLVALI
ncbi:MAG: class I SAM-dependent rRNA methyltransferase [Chloroflexota bacterium]|nr:class I SAM-dependent rRNA methyltransferase [Chloroflexota bacterium]